MQNQGFGNGYDHAATIGFFKKWWKLLMVVFVVASIASVVVSLIITPRFKATAVMFPTNSNRLSKAIMDYHYSLDFMDYGIERDCEYAIQILSSKSMEEAVCDHFNMMEHYGISENDPHKGFKLSEMYRDNVNIKRTEFLGIEIGVMDVDPQWAADIANFIADHYDSLCHVIHQDRAQDAYTVMSQVCEDLQAEVYALEDKMANDPAHRQSNAKLLSDKCEQLADLQTRASQTKIDRDLSVSYKFWLDKASPADKKAYPKRAIIVLLGAFGSLIMCILVLLLVEGAYRKQD